MLKNLLTIQGACTISKQQQSMITGGAVDKCCIRIPTHGIRNSDGVWCNSRPACSSSSCAC